MMLSLGLFAFGLDTLAYQELARRTDYRHATSPRVGAREASQYLGPGRDAISLTGWLAPAFAGDPASLDTLREMAAGGDAWPLVDGTGAVHGAFVITGIDARGTIFFDDGTPRRIDFAVDLEAVD